MLDALISGGGSLGVSLTIFLISAVVVWRAGTRLAGYADRFAAATGLGGALVGLLLLGGITSLPEIATSATAAVAGSAALASNNLIGGVALQLLVLPVVDVLVGRQALTAKVPRPDVLAYAAMNVIMLALVAGAIAAGDLVLPGLGIGAGSVFVALSYILCLRTASAIDRGPMWRPTDLRPGRGRDDEGPARRTDDSVTQLVLLLAGVGLVILAAGFLLTRSGEALAEQTGLGANFFGAVFLAGATSLPELSSAIAAVRLGRPQMAIGDALGGNMFNLSLILLVDVLYREGPVLGGLGAFSIAAAVLGVLLCGILMLGMLERRNRTIVRMGYDSAAMLVVYAVGVVVLYALRGAAA